jgi:hypothetical protein
MIGTVFTGINDFLDANDDNASCRSKFSFKGDVQFRFFTHGKTKALITAQRKKKIFLIFLIIFI